MERFINGVQEIYLDWNGGKHSYRSQAVFASMLHEVAQGKIEVDEALRCIGEVVEWDEMDDRL